MMIAAIRAGIVFFVMLTLLGVAQTQSVLQTGMLFLAVGLLPGINLEVSANLVLAAVAWALMVVLAWLFGRYMAHRAAVRRWLPRYTRPDRRDPPLDELLPAIKGLRTATYTVLQIMDEVPGMVRLWLRHLGNPAAGQTVAVRSSGMAARVRLDRWEPARQRALVNAATLDGLVREWAQRARAYLERLTMR